MGDYLNLAFYVVGAVSFAMLVIACAEVIYLTKQGAKIKALTVRGKAIDAILELDVKVDHARNPLDELERRERDRRAYRGVSL